MVRTYASPFESDYLEKKNDLLLICIPVFLLLIVAFPYTNRGYWEDEIFSINASRTWSGLLGIFHNYENNMALYYAILHGWMRIFGEGEVATHSLSLLFALLTIPVFYKLQRIWLNKSTALAGCLLLVANPLFLFYSVESRSYSLLVLTAAISTLTFFRLLQKPGYLLAILYGLSVAAATYSHYFGILVLLVHGLTISLKKLTRLHIISILLSGMVIVIAILPLFLFPPKNKSQVDWIPKPEFKYLAHTILDLFGGIPVFLMLILCLFFGAKKTGLKYAKDDGYFLSRLAIVWTIAPIGLLFLFSWLVKPVFITRFFVWCLPGAVILTCLIIGYTGWSRILKSVVLVLLLSVLLIRSYSILHIKGSGYKDAAQYLNEHVAPGESVLAYPYYKSIHTDYYLDKIDRRKLFARPLAITKLPYLPGGGGRDPDPDIEMLQKLAADNKKVYLLCRYQEGPANTDSMQNRSWLPEIQKIIVSKHPKQQDLLFGAGSEECIRITIYE